MIGQYKIIRKETNPAKTLSFIHPGICAKEIDWGDKLKHGPIAGSRLVNGCKNSGLPWSDKLEKDKLFWDFF